MLGMVIEIIRTIIVATIYRLPKKKLAIEHNNANA